MILSRLTNESLPWRLRTLEFLIVAGAIVLIARLFFLQVVKHEAFEARASSQQDISRALMPRRGTIFMRDGETQSLVPVATTQDLGFVFANPSEIEDVETTVKTLVDVLGLRFDEPAKEPDERAEIPPAEEPMAEDEKIVGTELDVLIPEVAGETIEGARSAYDRFVQRLSNKRDPYEPVARGVREEALAKLRELDLPGISYIREPTRLYPETGVGGHVLGFVGRDEYDRPVGRYGVEGYWEETLAGTAGYLKTQKDPGGRLVVVGGREYEPAQDGADIVLTIDRTIQFMACRALKQAVLQHEAKSGSVVILDPQTGDVLALCGYPDFDPARYGDTESIDVFNNPVTFGAYEPGSVFKAVTMAAGLDTGAVTPSMTYEDTGIVDVRPKPIRNSDKKAHGIVTMTGVLEQSLNTGVAFVVGKTGYDVFRSYVEQFGFGQKTGLPLDTEVAGNVTSLEKEGDTYPITASFGQGITATTIQIAQAYGAIANGGILLRPRLVAEVRMGDGVVKELPREQIRRVISEKAARLLGAMLVSVVERGHGRRAGVGGYYIAGKTGTAQIAVDGVYSDTRTIGSFAGFGPVDNPRFVMVTRIDEPTSVQFAESTAAPLFGDIAKFLLEYLDVPPTRMD
ncbi:penicillin-binding protein 2 [Candidatus Uhrbacteria bacterium]|nr:penicillin-binding protein 2 [Candidatus Uhrbacteria bacterium]